MKIPVMIQMQNGENGVTALCMMLGYHRKYVPVAEMREACVSSRNGSSPKQIADAAKHFGLDANIEKVTAQDLRGMKFPVMIQWKRRYYAIIKSIRGNLVTVVDPASGEYKLEMSKLEALFTGTAISFTEDSTFRPGGRHESLASLVGRRMKPLMRPMRVLFVFAVLCVLLNLAMMNTQKSILDKFMGSKDEGTILSGYIMLVLYALLMLLYTGAGMLRTRLVNRSSRSASAESGMNLFKKIFSQPMRFFELFSAGELMARIDNNITLDNSILKTLVPRLIDVVMTLVYACYLFRYNASMAAVCLALFVFSIICNLYVQEKNAIAAKSMTTSGNIVNASLLNGMNMIDTIQSTGAERAFYNKWHGSQVEFNIKKQSQIKFSALSSFISNLSGNLLQATQLFMGAWLVVHGHFTVGSMALFQGILGSMISSVNNCITALDLLQTMRTGIERVNDILDRDTRPAIPLDLTSDEEPDKLRGRLSAKDICYRYNSGDHLALDHVSLEIEPGQMVAIVGSTGCGKSTLLKILADLYTAESGEILYDDKTRDQIPDVIFHSSVTTVDQEAVMFEDSIYNNIRMWDSTIENYEVIMAAKDAQIHDRIIRESRDYGTMIKENGRNFSGGELQRLELARSLAHEPTLLLLDEFTSALDALTEDKAMQALRIKGTTCVIVAHRLSTIVDCDRIYVMDKGRIVQQGTHAELYKQDGLYRTLVG
ncbi:MAG: ATP-binding cassette domain-containing protein [Mogibacterium sp.]|nr:ATP-binding cassette domain-containing protein [Mogibacterium sp.]